MKDRQNKMIYVGIVCVGFFRKKKKFTGTEIRHLLFAKMEKKQNLNLQSMENIFVLFIKHLDILKKSR